MRLKKRGDVGTDRMKLLAIDIGGTTIRCARATRSGLEEEPQEFDAETVGSADALAERLADSYDGIDAIGVAVAGVVDRESNTVLEAANWSNWDLEPLAEFFGAPLTVENDADASAVGLLEYSNISEESNFAYITISTGIGGGVIQQGQLVPGVEAGFMNVKWDGQVEHADVSNPWEGYASGSCFPVRLQEWLETETESTTLSGGEDMEAFFEAVYRGDGVAREYYTELKRINAAGFGSLTNVFGLDRIVLGGSVALNHPTLGDYDEDPHTTQEVDLSDYTITAPPEIELTDFGDNLELYGAAAAAARMME